MPNYSIKCESKRIKRTMIFLYSFPICVTHMDCHKEDYFVYLSTLDLNVFMLLLQQELDLSYVL